MSIEQAFADLREEAAILRRNGHKAQADTLEAACDRLAATIPNWLDWLSESDARARSGWGVDRLRAWFAVMAPMGAAELRGRVRYYRAAVIPARPNLEAARAAGAREGRAA